MPVLAVWSESALYVSSKATAKGCGHCCLLCWSAVYDEAPVPAERADALAASGGSANAIAFPSGSETFTWRTPFE